MSSVGQFDEVNVFAYQDFRVFLKDYYQKRRQKDRKFSIRFFARRAGLRSQNYLKVVMDGQRSLTPRNIPKFIKGLNLNTNQAEYFEALVNLNQARDANERQNHMDRIEHLKKKNAAVTLKGRQLEVFSAWQNIVIYEMATQDGFNLDPAHISRKLKGQITPDQAQDALNLLWEVGMITKDEAGKWKAVAVQIASPEQIPKDILLKLHEGFWKKGTEAMKQLPPEQKDMRSLTVGLTKEQVPLFKEKLRAFSREMNTLFSTGRGKDVFQLNIQFFQLTKSDDEV